MVHHYLDREADRAADPPQGHHRSCYLGLERGRRYAIGWCVAGAGRGGRRPLPCSRGWCRSSIGLRGRVWSRTCAADPADVDVGHHERDWRSSSAGSSARSRRRRCSCRRWRGHAARGGGADRARDAARGRPRRRVTPHDPRAGARSGARRRRPAWPRAGEQVVGGDAGRARRAASGSTSSRSSAGRGAQLRGARRLPAQPISRPPAGEGRGHLIWRWPSGPRRCRARPWRPRS